MTTTGDPMARGVMHECTCGAWVIFGQYATAEDFDGWEADHGRHRPIRLHVRLVDGAFVDVISGHRVRVRDGRLVDDDGRAAELAPDMRGRRVVVVLEVKPGEFAASFVAARELRPAVEAAGVDPDELHVEHITTPAITVGAVYRAGVFTFDDGRTVADFAKLAGFDVRVAYRADPRDLPGFHGPDFEVLRVQLREQGVHGVFFRYELHAPPPPSEPEDGPGAADEVHP
jgi:hypothetical protein